MADYLFSYGTLQPRYAPPEVKDTVRRFRRIGRGRVRGRLYDMGEYPAAIIDPKSENEITGVIFEIPGGSGVLKMLDTYEEFNPRDRKSSLFVRRRAVINTPKGPVRCWVYVYNRALDGAPVSNWTRPKRKAART